tara:strand:- start:56 stop:202 length:147 start_codon:yes stop_codon:yes gene_type:complete
MAYKKVTLAKYNPARIKFINQNRKKNPDSEKIQKDKERRKKEWQNWWS